MPHNTTLETFIKHVGEMVHKRGEEIDGVRFVFVSFEPFCV